METRWLYKTSSNFAQLREESKNVCVIPMGCVEKHGLHMAVGCDIIMASHIAYMASQLETFCVFPDFTFGDLPSGAPIEAEGGSMSEGNITIPVEMELQLLETICHQISRNGYKKILIYNCHGGNKSLLNTFQRMLNNKKRDFVVGVVGVELQAPHNMAKMLEKNGSGSIPELTKEDEELLLRLHKENMIIGHAGFGETAYLMELAPDSFKWDKLGIESGLPTGKARAYIEAGIQLADGGWDLDFPNAYCGHDPIECNERIGKASVRIEAERLAHAARFFKEDSYLLERLAEIQKGW
ncbi:MAG: creatininase family protein [Clostridia bacterium]|nr:creatininase family protein [Clostridia bacterium]